MSQPLPREPESEAMPKGGFGSPIRKEKPSPTESAPQGKSGLVTGVDGKIRTTSHKPYAS